MFLYFNIFCSCWISSERLFNIDCISKVLSVAFANKGFDMMPLCTWLVSWPRWYKVHCTVYHGALNPDIKFKMYMILVGVGAVPCMSTQGSTRGQQLVPSCTELSKHQLQLNSLGLMLLKPDSLCLYILRRWLQFHKLLYHLLKSWKSGYSNS